MHQLMKTGEQEKELLLKQRTTLLSTFSMIGELFFQMLVKHLLRRPDFQNLTTYFIGPVYHAINKTLEFEDFTTVPNVNHYLC